MLISWDSFHLDKKYSHVLISQDLVTLLVNGITIHTKITHIYTHTQHLNFSGDIESFNNWIRLRILSSVGTSELLQPLDWVHPEDSKDAFPNCHYSGHWPLWLQTRAMQDKEFHSLCRGRASLMYIQQRKKSRWSLLKICHLIFKLWGRRADCQARGDRREEYSSDLRDLSLVTFEHLIDALLHHRVLQRTRGRQTTQ